MLFYGNKIEELNGNRNSNENNNESSIEPNYYLFRKTFNSLKNLSYILSIFKNDYKLNKMNSTINKITYNKQNAIIHQNSCQSRFKYFYLLFLILCFCSTNVRSDNEAG